MQVRYIGMFDSVEVPGLSPDPANVVVEVSRGEVVAVPAGPDQAAIAKGLLIQLSNWEAVDDEAKAAKAEALAERDAQLRERGVLVLHPAEPVAAGDAPGGEAETPATTSGRGRSTTTAGVR